ncbi:hypothetical protein ZWY2020_021132 [Hordeum vulgare]|nr:hypothetical protein ZWY2020_021132 [Hordeum vulgare]
MAFGGMIFVLVYCTAGVSGTHQPGGDLRVVPGEEGVAHPGAALHHRAVPGAICGVGLVKGFQSSYYVRYGGGANELSAGYSKGTGLAAEIIGTFVLVYGLPPLTLSATPVIPTSRCWPLPIGFVVFMVHLATIPITGTGINPARSLGAAVIYNTDKAWMTNGSSGGATDRRRHCRRLPPV